MNFKKKVKFLNQWEENLEKLDFYLDLIDKQLSFGPCLIMKKYYKWALKHIYNLQICEEQCEAHFLNVIEKLDYKVVANMEYGDFRDLLLAYFSLGEFYYNLKQFQQSKEYFLKAANMMEESLKSGNKYQTEEIQGRAGVVFFELLMWARKNLGDIEQGAEALELYESIIGEEECLYVEKHYSIYKTAKELNMPATANEAARSVMKLLSTYKGLNVEVVDYLIGCAYYENALDIVSEEYVKNDVTHWINKVNIICREAKELNEECVHKVINFLNLLLGDLKIVEWSTVAYTLYKNVRSTETTHIKVLDYLRDCFNRVKGNDFTACGQAILVLKEIYNDISIEKYEKEYLRSYEFDFVLYLMKVAVQNESYENGLEVSAKLKSIIEVTNMNKELYPYVDQCFEICKEKVLTEECTLDSYPWNYLYDNLKVLSEAYGINSAIRTLDIARNSSNKIIVGISSLEDENIGSIINEAVGENIFHKGKDVVFITNEPMEVDHHISDNHSYEVIVKKGLLKQRSCIMTYENYEYARVTDFNVILVDGHKELRDIDITYVKHIFKESLNNKILLLVDSAAVSYSQEVLTYNKTMIKTLLNFENVQLVDMSTLSSKRDVLDCIIGQCPENIMEYKFKSFNRDITEALDVIKEDIKTVKAVFKERRYIVSECGREYSYIEEELNNNHREFTAKVKNDIEFLRKYAGDKIASVIPDLLETRLSAIDDLEDLPTLKVKAEEILSKAVDNWCSKNIYRLMLEQFQVYMAKYSKFYSFHEETIERINENRKNLITSHPEFEENMGAIEIMPLEEMLQEFLNNYEAFLQSIDYKVNVIPNEPIISAVKEGIKVMFLKNEEKAENLRVKIKGLVSENKNNISKLVTINIEEKLTLLEVKLQEIIETLFKSAEEVIAKENSMVNGTIETIDGEYNLIKKKNEAVIDKMQFIEIETLKYSKEVEVGMVYYNDKCYVLN